MCNHWVQIIAAALKCQNNLKISSQCRPAECCQMWLHILPKIAFKRDAFRRQQMRCCIGDKSFLATGQISKQKQYGQQSLSHTKLRAYLDPDVHSEWQGWKPTLLKPTGWHATVLRPYLGGKKCTHPSSIKERTCPCQATLAFHLVVAWEPLNYVWIRASEKQDPLIQGYAVESLLYLPRSLKFVLDSIKSVKCCFPLW